MTEIIDLGPRLKANLAWDLLSHDEVRDYLPVLGLVPPSDEGLEMDHEEAHRRADLVVPIAPLIVAISTIASDVHATYTISEAEELLSAEDPGDFDEEDDDDDEEDDEEVETVYRSIVGNIITSASLAVIAELLSARVLSIGPGAIQR